MPASKIQPEQVYAIKHDDGLVRFYVKAVVTDIRQITPSPALDLFRSHPSCWSTAGWGKRSAGRAGRSPGQYTPPCLSA